MEELEIKIEEPENPTDMKVIFDPEISKPIVATAIHSDNETVENSDGKSTDVEEIGEENYNSTKTDGYDAPILMLNQQVIPPNFIETLTIDYTGFVPKLELTVNDPENRIQFIGSPGMKNFVAVVLCPQSDGIYRSISLPFYIKERINETTKKIKYVCEYYNLGLTDVKSTQIGDDQLTTYEFCEKIAKMLGFGFAATDNCKTVSDKRYRQSYSQRFIDFIQQQINISGTDADNILDAWIDTHGYLVLVNVSWVFEQNVKAENLSIVVKPQLEIPISNIPENEPFKVLRALTNIEHYPINNLVIAKKYHKMNTEKTHESGTEASFWCLTGVGDTNTLEMQDIQMKEESIEGEKTETYTFRKSIFLGCDMSEDTPYLIQEQIRKRWLEKKRVKYLIVELMKPNYGLERGTLLTIGSYESDPEKIRTISQNIDNVVEPNVQEGDEPEPYKVDDSKEPESLADVTDGSAQMINPTMSGLYYIDGMKYIYENKKIIQVLYLIKKGEDNNLFHNKGIRTVTTNQKEEYNKEIS